MRQPIINFFKMGQDPATICTALQLNPEGVSQVIQQYLNDPQAVFELVASVLQESQRFRCPNSTKLICEPVMTIGDTKPYDLRSLPSMDPSRLQPNTALREVIRRFSLNSLKTLETCLPKNVETDTVVALMAECVSVLDPVLHIESISKIKATTEQYKLLLVSLSALVPPEFLRTVLGMIQNSDECQAITLAIYRHFLTTHKDPRHYDADFSAFLSFLNKYAANPLAVNFAIELIETCNPSQLVHLQSALNSSTDNQLVIILGLRILKKEESVPQTLLALLEKIVRVVFEEKEKVERVSSLESFHAELGRLDAKFNTLKAESGRVEKEIKVASNINVVSRRPEEEDQNDYPEFIYSYVGGTGTVHWTKLSSGEQFTCNIPQVYGFCSWCALPQEHIYFTGGQKVDAATNEVVSFDKRSLFLTQKPAMLRARQAHNTVYTEGYLYAIGGLNGPTFMTECERYSVAANEWEAISPLLIGVVGHSLILQESTQCIYVLGGQTVTGSGTDAMQELDLRTNIWTQLSFSLPSLSPHTYWIPSFKSKATSEDFFFVLDSKLYSWNPNSAPRLIKCLTSDISSYCSPSYYSQGTLFCLNYSGAVQKLVIGSLV